MMDPPNKYTIAVLFVIESNFFACRCYAFTPSHRPEARVINYLQVDYERRGTRQNLVAVWNSEFKLTKSAVHYFRQTHCIIYNTTHFCRIILSEYLLLYINPYPANLENRVSS